MSALSIASVSTG